MSTLEIIRRSRPVKRPKVAILDFDGTISLICQGWREAMVAYFVNLLLETPRGLPQGRHKLAQMVTTFVDENTGKPTILQMQRIAREVAEHGGNPLTPEEYYRGYSKLANPPMMQRLEALQDGSMPREEMLVDGTVELLEMLQNEGVRLCLASGSHRDFVIQECEALQILDYFDAGIYGATRGSDSFKKSEVITALLKTYHIESAELIGFGDGHTETRNVYEIGGFSVGVASDELRKSNLDQHKRGVLIAAGADIVIPDYRNTIQLHRHLFVTLAEAG